MISNESGKYTISVAFPYQNMHQDQRLEDNLEMKAMMFYILWASSNRNVEATYNPVWLSKPLSKDPKEIWAFSMPSTFL
jgi:cytochrome c